MCGVVRMANIIEAHVFVLGGDVIGVLSLNMREEFMTVDVLSRSFVLERVALLRNYWTCVVPKSRKRNVAS